MDSTRTFENARRSAVGCRPRSRQTRGIAVAAILMLFHQSVVAVDDLSPGDSTATQAIQEQLRKQAAERSAAANEKQSAISAAAAIQKDISQLRADLEAAVQRLAAQEAAAELATRRESDAATAIASLQRQLRDHRAADALQARADAAFDRLTAQRDRLAQLNEQLAGLHEQSFRADQAARRADREAEALSGQAEEARQMLSGADQAASEAGFELEDARIKSVESARQLADWEQRFSQALRDAARARTFVERLTNSAAAIRNSIVAIKQTAGISAGDTDEQVTRLSALLQQMAPLQTHARQMLETRVAVVEELREQHTAAAQIAASAESTRRLKADAHSELSRKHFALQREVLRLESASQQRRNRAAEFTGRKDQLALKIARMREETAGMGDEVAVVEGDWVDLQRQAEQALEPLGRFVSFSREIAPILSRRCTACHNTRTSDGRLNLSSFAALLKGGDSGDVLAPHDPDGSLLLLMVQDGSMPKDADPLAEDEIDSIRRWIDVGAPLDAGIAVSSDLFDIMPEQPQPLPPATYRVPIPVLAAAFSPDGSLLATSGYHEVLLWGTDGTLVRRIANVAQRVNDVEFTADGATLVVAAGTPGQLGEVKRFRVADGRHLGTLVRTTDSVYSVSVSPDGTRLAAGGADQKIVIVDMQSHEILRTIEDHSDSVMDVAWAPQSDRIVSASFDRSCRVFQVETGEVEKTYTQHGAPVYTVSFLPDGTSIVSGGADQKLRVWPVADGDQIREIGGFGDPVFRLAVTDGGRVYSAGADRQIHEHTLADGKLVRRMTGHSDWVYALAVDADGRRLASGCYDGEVRLWNSEDGTMAGSFVAVPEQGDTSVTAFER